MLIGNGSKKPSLEDIRRIKNTLRGALELSEDSMITVAQLACLEEDCAPLETVIGLLRPNAPQLQHKLHKATNAVNAADLTEVCSTWGFTPPKSIIEELFKEN